MQLAHPSVYILLLDHASVHVCAYCLYSVYIIFSGSTHAIAGHTHTAAQGWSDVVHGACLAYTGAACVKLKGCVRVGVTCTTTTKIT